MFIPHDTYVCSLCLYICIISSFAKETYDNTYVYCVLMFMSDGTYVQTCLCLMIHMCARCVCTCVSSGSLCLYICIISSFAKETYDNTYVYCVLMFMSDGTYVQTSGAPDDTSVSSALLQKRPMMIHMYHQT